MSATSTINPTTTQPRAWWKESSVYQIYPASFKDTNGDGVGDLQGVISKVDYLQALGSDIVWLSPIFKSPQVDMGYDVSDYYDIHAPYGSLEDVDTLIRELHARNMKLVLDLVVNHTSDQHPWFIDSKSSTSSPYRDWYIWRKPRFDSDGRPQPPNNWEAHFRGSAWEYDEASGEYYLHLFAKEQPDLNWENEAVRAAVHKIIRFWLDRGVDGYRMDVINFISKYQDFPDAPITDHSSKWQTASMYYACGPRLHEYLQDIGRILKEYDAFSVGEMPGVDDPHEIIKVVGADRGELNMIFNFEHVKLDYGSKGKFSARQWQLSELKSITSKWQNFMHQNNGWNALYLENHDQPRSISRFASDLPEFSERSAKMLATFLGLQSGTVFVYQGQELGMANVPADWKIEDYRDIDTLNHWKEINADAATLAELKEASLLEYKRKSRDNARTPVQWDASPNAGFSISQPWISVHKDYQKCNAAAQVADKNSVYWYWSHILNLRKRFADIFVYGSFEIVSPDHPDVFAYARISSAGSALIVTNFRSQEALWTSPVPLPPHWTGMGAGKVVLSNYNSSSDRDLVFGESMTLRPLEAFVWIRESIPLSSP